MKPKTNEDRVMVANWEALMLPTVPVETWRKNRFEFRVKESFSREDVLQRLAHLGYLRMDSVEDPGTFSIRGDLLDLYIPAEDQPVRIEFFGDEVEGIRFFDPTTQRSSKDRLDSIEVTPCREVLILDSPTLLRERLKAAADERGIHRSIRDPIIQSIHERIYLDSSEIWAPYAYAQPSSVLDYLGDAFDVVWDSQFSCEQSFQSRLKRYEEDFEKPVPGTESRWILPSPKEIFESELVRRDRLKWTEKTRLHLDSLEVLDAQSASNTEDFPVEIQSARIFSEDVKKDFGLATTRLLSLKEGGIQVVLTASSASQKDRLQFLIQQKLGKAASEFPVTEVSLSSGFIWPSEKVALVPESDFFGQRVKNSLKAAKSKKKDSAAKDWSGVQNIDALQVGDAVVHITHGIGRYQGITRLGSDSQMDFLTLEYSGGDKLYIPIYRINCVQKYLGSGQDAVLDKLGGQGFEKAKQKVRDAVKKLAVDLVKVYAERQLLKGTKFSGRDPLFAEFEERFPFDETPDQAQAVDDVIGDLQAGKLMDRLVCGDVGYGKTEVAIRAAFKAASEGKQVAVLVPTTILAHQHEQSFLSRFKGYPLRIESLSRFKPAKKQKEILEDLKAGKVDVVIGTHRLLSKDVVFKDLALVIVDEEHRFGVEHKEKLKAMKTSAHVLTLTATPIPRTLHMALSGLREMSLIATPPVNRLPIKTFVAKQEDSVIRQAIESELGRGGQVFYVYNRVQSIYEIAEKIQRLVPAAKVGVGHGQMADSELEDAMLAFYQGRTNVLVCTTIIESGLDVPSANTLIVQRADTFGLSQLYQIRGRVGRGQNRAFAYFLIPGETLLSQDAQKRLEVLQRFVDLGSGFKIASHDLEIRGGGNLLGPEQSGHIAMVGFELYTQLLDEAIRQLKREGGQKVPALGAPSSDETEPEIKCPFPAFLPETYVSDSAQRLVLYRRLSATRTWEELDALMDELVDRYGPLPYEGKNLFHMITLKQLMVEHGMDSLTIGLGRVSLVAGSRSKLNPNRVVAMVASRPEKNPLQIQMTPQGTKLSTALPTSDLAQVHHSLEILLKSLSG
ncbi:MAG: transcription-repair coupling factor [Bdellovibrionales bacterium]|nr:transcription-repair coupling factor [Bdellovibrionales bacterium]